MNDADLEKLITKPVRLKPKFQRDVTEYEVVLDSSIKELKIDPLTRDCNASWQIVGIGTERCIRIEQGSNQTLVVEVTAEDGTIKNYNIHVISLSPSSAILSSLQVVNQNLEPKFSSNVFKYECNVLTHCVEIQLKTQVPDKTAQVQIEHANSENIIELNACSTAVKVRVISPDKTNTAEYIVQVKREKFVFPLPVLSTVCEICSGVLHNPVSIPSLNNHPEFNCCYGCFLLFTRTNKTHPLTGEKLENDTANKDFDKEVFLSNIMVKCPLRCDKEVSFRHLAKHIKDNCQYMFSWNESNESLVYNHLETDHNLNTFEMCSKCSRKLRQFDKQLHDVMSCSITSPNVSHKVKAHDWEKKYEQNIAAENVGDIIQSATNHERKYFELFYKRHYEEAMESLNAAAELYAFGAITQPNKFEYHFKLGKLMLEMYFLTEIYYAKATKDDVNNNTDDGFEFQTESSMIDDIKALTKQKGYNPSSTVDQLKALDEEYHFLLDQGQSEKADYIQKLYAYKQRQQLQETSGKAKKKLAVTPLLNEYLVRARQKFVDASVVGVNDFQCQLHAGISYLMERKYADALKLLTYAISLKPSSIDGKFYFALAAFKCKSVDKYQECYKQFLVDGINLYVYKNLHKEQNSQDFIYEKFETPYNILFLQGIEELLKSSKNESVMFYFAEDLYNFLISQSFHAMQKMPLRKNIFNQFQKIAFHGKYDLIIHQMRNCNQGDAANKIKKSWSDLLALVVHFCDSVDQDFILLKKQICEQAVRLQPRSNKALFHLADVLYSMYQLNSSDVNINDIETIYRCCIQLEAKDQNNGDIPDLLKETTLWKQWESKDQGKQIEKNNGSGKDVSLKKKSEKTLKTNSPKVSVPPPSKVTGRGRAKVTNPKTIPKATTISKPQTKPAGVGPKTNPRGHGSVKPQNIPPASTKSSQQTKSQNKNTSPQKPSTSKITVSEKLPESLNPKIPEASLALANFLVQESKNKEEAITLYKHVIETAPHLHDSYIELGDLYSKETPLEAVNIYCQYPFTTTPSYDDAYLHGEIVRILMKNEQFDDPRLLGHMISLGKIMGFSYLEKYVTQLENKNKNKFLRELYCGINEKSQDDSDVITFFKFKLWL